MVKQKKSTGDLATIPGMELENKYSTKNKAMSENAQDIKKNVEKTKKELEQIKTFILKKYPFTKAIGVLPPQSIKFFIEEEEVPKETEKFVQLYMIIPEEKFKEIPKIKKEIVKEIEKLKQKIWVQIKTPVDVWEICTDSKFELFSAISMSFPIYDTNFLSYLRVAEIHKSLVLQKFEKYVVSYVIGGSFVRGETKKTSDLDVFIIINDTDVKRMPRLELRERLRGIIYQYIGEASALAGVKQNILSPQIYLLTDFWESVKDAHPVIFTFIRDGVPIYDRGVFMPWKALLRMGRLKPSSEAIDMYMSLGDQTLKRSKKMMLDIVIQDIFNGVNTPSQALLMLYGLPPPNVKETVKQMKKIFVDKEKILEQKYVDMLKEITIKYYKGYEHGKIKEVSGKELDHLLKNTEAYLKRLKELRKQIEKRTQEKTIEEIYKDVFELLKIVTKKTSQAQITKDFEENFVKKGKFSPQNLRILDKIIQARSEFKKGKVKPHKIDEARKNASLLINDLIEFSQRKDLVSMEKGRMKLKYKKSGKSKVAELLINKGGSFLFTENNIFKITNKIQASSMDEVSRSVENNKQDKSLEIDPKLFELLKKELGPFQLVL
ncbi:nucleotidyltransferase domain-containing protein [Candidatus Pacearchaeota archaeon]|nr:nucleotidyltransferase domain-containing protein [Candidatus Pacearchaeota archaeon]